MTDDFLRAYYGRPELLPDVECFAVESALHTRLLDDPRALVSPTDLASLPDPDARENYAVVLDFRDRLLHAGTVEACYLNTFRSGDVTLIPLFLDQMVHVVLRNVLDGLSDPFQARAAELLFRQQNATIQDGAILLGDTETVDMLGSTGGFGSLGKLLVESGIGAKKIDLDVLQPETADIYWRRSGLHDIVLDISFTRPGLDALCRVLEAWIAHFLEADVVIHPVQEISDDKWVWHIGLDADASALLNDLYNDKEVSEERMRRLLSLFRLEFRDASLMRADIAGRPVYLALCMTTAGKVRLKPQNLLVNLPLAPKS